MCILIGMKEQALTKQDLAEISKKVYVETLTEVFPQLVQDVLVPVIKVVVEDAINHAIETKIKPLNDESRDDVIGVIHDFMEHVDGRFNLLEYDLKLIKQDMVSLNKKMDLVSTFND